MTTPQYTPPPQPMQSSEEIRITDLIVNVKHYFSHVLRKWWIILIITIVSGIAGGVYAFLQDEDYISRATYIIDSDAASSSFMSSIMSLAGTLGMPSSSSSEGFSNELLHGIMKSRRIMKAALVSRYVIDGQYDQMAHHLLRLYPDLEEDLELEGWRLTHDSLHQITFKEDSILEKLYLELLENHIEVEYSEEIALNILIVRSISRDFSVNLCNHILISASDFFIETAVAKETQSLNLAFEQSDSLFAILRAKENRLARITDQSGYKYKASGFLEEGRLLRDIEVMSTMYGESYASLQMAKYNLEDKKPIIEVVDAPEFSTYQEEIKLVAFSIIFAIVGAFLAVIFFILQKLIRDILSEEKNVVSTAPVAGAPHTMAIGDAVGQGTAPAGSQPAQDAQFDPRGSSGDA